MISGDWWGLSFPNIVLQMRTNPAKTSISKLARPGIELGPARWEEMMLPSTRAMVGIKKDMGLLNSLDVHLDVARVAYAYYCYIVCNLRKTVLACNLRRNCFLTGVPYLKLIHLPLPSYLKASFITETLCIQGGREIIVITVTDD